ncbi:MAG: HAD-IA family hydrolase [Nitrospirae bacterium]|nr:HAD-IA family hydrolase [Nitrospirota bacterium]
MPIELVIFDLDGTLVDSIGDIAGSVNYALGMIGKEALTLGEVRRLVGSGVEHLLLKAAGIDEHDLIQRDLLKGHFLLHYTEHLADQSRPYPNVINTLDALASMKKAVASNKLESLSKRLLDRLSMSGYFEAVYGYDSCGERKPSPVPILKLMETLGAGTTQTIIIGDSSLDIQAGHSAGIKAIAVSYGYRPIASLSDADYIVGDIGEILPIIKALP